jgi:hypothetical protein
MRNLVLIVLQLCLLSCSSNPAIVGKRVYLSKGNVSLVLPDSSLTYSKPILWGADYHLGSYGENGAIYYNRDSSVIASIYIQVYPNPEQRKLTWRIVADEKRRREELLAKNRNLAVIEQFTADSSARTITIDYHMLKQPEKGRLSQASYERDLTFYGPQRTIHFWFSGPDNATYRQAIGAACASVCVNPTYLQASVKPYPSREYQN